MGLIAHWCPRCEVQSERPWHLCKAAAPLFPQTAVETKCEQIEVVRVTDHKGAVEALRTVDAALSEFRDELGGSTRDRVDAARYAAREALDCLGGR